MQKRSFAIAAGTMLSWLAVSAVSARGACAQNLMSSRTTGAGIEKTLSKTDIAASPEAVFAVVEDFRAWGEWQWPTEMPIKRVFRGAGKGKGAVYEWETAGLAGSGLAKITEASAPGRIVVDLDLKTPVAGHLTWVFGIERVGDKTKLSVSTSGPPKLVTSSFDTIFGASPSLIRLGCVAGGEPYTGPCEVFMVTMPAAKAKAARH